MINIPLPDSFIAHSQVFMLASLFIVAILNLSSSRKEKRSIGWVMLAICEHNFFHISNIYGWTLEYSSILLLNQLTGIVFPLLLLRHAKAVSQGRPIPRFYYILIAIGLALAIGVHIEMLLYADVQDYIQRIAVAESPPLSYTITLAYTQTLIGLTAFYVFREIRVYRRKAADFTSNLDRTLLRYLWFYFIFLISGVICAMLFNSLIPSQLSHYFLVPGAFFFFFLATAALLYNIPVDILNAHDNIVDAAESEVLRPADKFAAGDMKNLEKAVEHHFKEKKIFLKGDLTIGKAALEMDVSIHELSRFVNEKQNLNFFEFVNLYRVEEAKNLMHNENARRLLTLEGIGKKAGFNSRASFYRAFKKFNGLSPGEYLSQSA